MLEEHKKICESLFQHAGTIIKEQGRLMSIFFVLQADKVILLELPKELREMEDGDQRKRLCFQTAQMVCEQAKCDALIHLTEAWVVEGSKELDKYKGKPSEHPDRKYSITLIYLSPNGDRQVLCGDIVQLVDANMKVLGEGKWVEIKEIPLAGDTKPPNATLQ